MARKPERSKEIKRVGGLVEKQVPKITPVNMRQIKSAVQIDLDMPSESDIAYMHSVLCQTCLPYRNPGNEITVWERKQGNASLSIQTMQVKNPTTQEHEYIGLPFGPKARLILAHINTEAIVTQKQRIYVQDSMTAYVRALGFRTDGRALSAVKDQLKRLAAAMITLSYDDEERHFVSDSKIIKTINLWFPKDDKQKVLWDSYVDLSGDYFESLQAHAVPLDIRAMASLSNNAMALDIYAWLAQRLHRIKQGKGQFIAWKVLKDQFGHNYANMRKFKQVYRDTLNKVIVQYPEARHSISEVENKGLILNNASPPIPKKHFQMLGGKE